MWKTKRCDAVKLLVNLLPQAHWANAQIPIEKFFLSLPRSFLPSLPLFLLSSLPPSFLLHFLLLIPLPLLFLSLCLYPLSLSLFVSISCLSLPILSFVTKLQHGTMGSLSSCGTHFEVGPTPWAHPSPKNKSRILQAMERKAGFNEFLLKILWRGKWGGLILQITQ